MSDIETTRARVINMAEYWDVHPHLTRHEVEQVFGLTRDVPDSAEIDGLKQDVQSLTKQVASLRKAFQELTKTQRLEKQPPLNRPVKTVKL